MCEGKECMTCTYFMAFTAQCQLYTSVIYLYQTTLCMGIHQSTHSVSHSQLGFFLSLCFYFDSLSRSLSLTTRLTNNNGQGKAYFSLHFQFWLFTPNIQRNGSNAVIREKTFAAFKPFRNLIPDDMLHNRPNLFVQAWGNRLLFYTQRTFVYTMKAVFTTSTTVAAINFRFFCLTRYQ